jgi:SpoIIAA-like
MITELTDMPASVIGFSLEGMVSAEDYEKILIPAIASALKAGHKLRLLVVMGPEFQGYALGAMWDDAAFGLRHFFDFEKIACLTDNETYGTMVRSFGFLMPAMVRVFPVKDAEAAKAWLAE